MVWYVVPCDSSGNPQSSFKRGTLAYFKIRVTNLDMEPREVLMTVNIYYSDNTPFGAASIETEIAAQSDSKFIISIPIPKDATLGTATAYANAYTDWPKLGGTPYCSEVGVTFEITGSDASSQTTQEFFISETNETGNFKLSLTLPKKSAAGNYTIYVSSRYLGEETFNSTTFKVFIPGDIDGDGDVDAWDLALFRQAYVYEYDPKADLNFDGVVDGWDLALFRQAYITYS